MDSCYTSISCGIRQLHTLPTLKQFKEIGDVTHYVMGYLERQVFAGEAAQPGAILWSDWDEVGSGELIYTDFCKHPNLWSHIYKTPSFENPNTSHPITLYTGIYNPEYCKDVKQLLGREIRMSSMYKALKEGTEVFRRYL